MFVFLLVLGLGFLVVIEVGKVKLFEFNMLLQGKNRNILNALFEREIGNYGSSIRFNPKLLRRHIESDRTCYKVCWKRKSRRLISYDEGYLFFENFSNIYTVYGPRCCPTKAFTMQTGKAREKILDVIVYSQPVVRESFSCMCGAKKCLCFKNFFVFLTKDQWLLKCNFDTGSTMTDLYVKSRNHDYGFGYCTWSAYGYQFTLTSRLNPNFKSKVVGYMAVFTVSPFCFKYMFELSKDVFGKRLRSVNISEQLLITAMGLDQVQIYSFEDVLKEGVFVNDDSNGTHTAGLGINLLIQEAPPVLFKVDCLGQSVQFGGYPYHCLFPKPRQAYRFILKNLDNSNVPSKGFVECDSWWSESVGVRFHPDFSNRIITQNLKSLHCHEIINSDNLVSLKEAYTIKFSEFPNSSTDPEFSRFGRVLKQTTYFSCDRSIFAMDYDDELDLICVLGAHPKDAFLHGFIKLYDGSSGKEVKTIDFKGSLNEDSDYQLNIDLDVIVVIVKDFGNIYRSLVYRLDSTETHMCSRRVDV